MGGVLICDDAVAYGVLFARWMRDAGIPDVAHARTAAEAEAIAEELQPELIVVDHLLPDATSDVLVPRLRALVPAARVLLISGMSDDRLALAARAAGADGHLAKATSADAMRDAVATLLA
jgi:two-component system response regulator DesR